MCFEAVTTVRNTVNGYGGFRESRINNTILFITCAD